MSELNIVCVLDRSGSMDKMMSEMVESFNMFVKDQKKEDPNALLTLVSFNTHEETIFDKVPLKKAKALRLTQVRPMGGTALYDAIGRAITLVNSPNTVVLIQTDGEENCSNVFTSKAVKEMVKLKEDTGWKFVFIGSGLDSFAAERSSNSMINSLGLDSHKHSVTFSNNSINASGALGARGPQGPQGDMGVYGTILSSAVASYKSDMYDRL